MSAHAGSGTLVAVVGASGAGKDTLIAAARAALAGDPLFVFPQRVVTRPADPAAEAHASASVAEFERLEADGAFAAVWRSHGHGYGIPAAIDAEIRAGRIVIVNVSRGAVEALRARYRRVIVIEVTARPDVLARRLAARGRESADDIARRLARKVEGVKPPVVGIDNSDALEDAAHTFVAICRDAAM